MVILEKETFAGKGIVVEVHPEAGCVMQFKVTLDSEVTKKCYKKAIKITNKRISIPGFRKGKAPDASVLERYPSHIEQEFRDNIIQESFESALDLSKIYPIRKESITPPKIVHSSQEEGSEVTFSFEVAPKTDAIDFSKITLPEVAEEPVDEKRVEELVTQIRTNYATYQKEEPRAAQEGDYVDLTIHSIFENGEVHPVVVERRFKVNEEMQDWLRKVVVGMEVGEAKKSNPHLEGTSSHEDLKNTSFSIELLAIHSIVLPEFNDELAEKVGAKTTEEVMEKIRHNLKQQAVNDREEKELKNLEEELLTLYPIELPSSLIIEEKRERMKDRLSGLKAMKLSDEKILERQKEIEDEIHEAVVRAIRLYFLNQQIAKQGEIVLSKEELNTLLAEEVMHKPHLYQKEVNSEELKQRVVQIQSMAYQRKVERYALAQVRGSSK